MLFDRRFGGTIWGGLAFVCVCVEPVPGSGACYEAPVKSNLSLAEGRSDSERVSQERGRQAGITGTEGYGSWSFALRGCAPRVRSVPGVKLGLSGAHICYGVLTKRAYCLDDVHGEGRVVALDVVPARIDRYFNALGCMKCCVSMSREVGPGRRMQDESETALLWSRGEVVYYFASLRASQYFCCVASPVVPERPLSPFN